MVIAFETSDEIPVDTNWDSLVLNSVTVTATFQSGSSGNVQYSTTPITPEGLLSDALGAGISSQLPMELFGVGFRDGFNGFALGPDQSGKRFSESTHGYSAADGGYVAYPVIGDGDGGYLDVSNNITGGFSATAPSTLTTPFTAQPWSSGVVPDLVEGENIPLNTTFTFQLDLQLPGVEGYVRESIAAGALGFIVSSMHPAAQPGQGGGGPYPQWITKEFGAAAATLTLDFEIEEGFAPGDYTRDGMVDAADYQFWRAEYGKSTSHADGNQDGVVDAADYAIWRNAAELTAPNVGSAVPAPELPGLSAAILLSVSVGCCATRGPAAGKRVRG